MTTQAEVDLEVLGKVLDYIQSEGVVHAQTFKKKHYKAYNKLYDRLAKVYTRTHNKLYPAQGTHTDAN